MKEALGRHLPAERIWTAFCDRFDIARKAVPLFDANANGVVTSRMVGRGQTARLVLSRSAAMEVMVRDEVERLVADWRTGTHRLDGLIYMIGSITEQKFVPLYIGKTETLGKGDANLSANIANLDRDTSKFARWGDNYAYHVGDLSACVLPGHSASKLTQKYQAWAERLFVSVPSDRPQLKEPVYFWAKAWDKSWVGVWSELGATRLAFLEYLLIGVASLASDRLLNREGIARS
jgi:hypothetical protein